MAEEVAQVPDAVGDSDIVEQACPPDVEQVSAPDIEQVCAPDVEQVYAPDGEQVYAPDMEQVSAPDMEQVCPVDAEQVCPVDAEDACQPDAQKAFQPDAEQVCPPDVEQAYLTDFENTCPPDFEYVCPPEFDEREEMRKMYVGGLSKETTDEEFKEYFESFGELADAVIVRKEKENKMFGFVTFKKCDDLDDCLLKRPLKLRERELECKRAVPKGTNSSTAHLKTKKLFLAYVTPKMTEQEVRDYLRKRHPEKYGKIEEISILKKKDEKGNEMDENRGFGFITVSNEDLADRISIGEMKFDLGGGSRPQEIKKAEIKDRSGGGGAMRAAHDGSGGWGAAGSARAAAGYGPGYGAAYDPWGGYGGYYGGYGAYDPYGYYSGYGYGGAPGYGGYRYRPY